MESQHELAGAGGMGGGGPGSSKAQLLPLLVIPFCIMTGTGMMFPILALLADRDGSGLTGAGILLAAFAVARLATNVPAGMAADRIGRRGVMIAGLLVLTIGSIGTYWARGLPATALCILLIGGGSSIALTATLAALTDLSGPANRGTMMSRYQTSVLVGIAMGPVTGGLLSSRFVLEAPFLLQAAMALGALALTLAFVPRRPPEAPQGRAGKAGSGLSRALFLSAGFGVLCLVTFTLFMTRTATSWQIVPIIAREQFGLTYESVGLLLTAGALANLCVQPSIGRLIDRLGAPFSILLGGLAMVVSFLLVSYQGDVRALWAGVLLMGVASGLLAPSLNTFAVDVSQAGYGTTLGALRTAGDAGLVLGPLLLGPVLALLGVSHQEGLVASAGAMALSTALFVLVHGKRLLPSRSERK